MMQGSSDSAGRVADELTPLSPFPSVQDARRPRPPLPVAHRSSDYLLVDPASPTGSIDAKDIDLPRPRFWYILPLLGLADLACSLAFIGINANHGRFGRNEAAVGTWGLARSVAITLASSNVRVREIGWFVVGSAFVSALVALAEVNLIIQNRTWTTTLPYSMVSYCISHLFFGLAHWLAFAAVVGTTRDRNPYGLGLRTAGRGTGARRAVWQERVTHAEFSRAGVADVFQDEPGQYDEDGDGPQGEQDWERAIRRRQALNDTSFASSDEEVDEAEDSEGDYPIDALRYGEHEEEDEAISSDDDPDDIVDIIPSPSTSRHRTISHSRSLRFRQSLVQRRRASSSANELEPSSPSVERSSGGMAGYGTFRSLSGI